MALNYNSVLNQLQAYGLLVASGDLIISGRKIVRCCTVDAASKRSKEKKGWYCLHEIRTDSGDDLIVGVYGIWSGNEKNQQKIVIDREFQISKAQTDAIRERIRADAKRAAFEAKRVAERAAGKAAKAWSLCSERPVGDAAHPYLVKKGIQSYGLRYSPQNALVMPLLNAGGVIQGLQIIRDQSQQTKTRNALDKQYWPSGLAKKGHFFQLGMPVNGSPVLICEGYATAASLHAATGLPVVVALDAGNLLPVGQAIRKRYKLARILFCADDDQGQKCHHRKEGESHECRQRIWIEDGSKCSACGEFHKGINAGVSAASTAAMAVNGAWVAPVFAQSCKVRDLWLTRGIKKTDFNDLQELQGLQEVRAQIQAKLLVLNWHASQTALTARANAIEGDGDEQAIKPFDDAIALLERFCLVYEHGDSVFDAKEHSLIPLTAMRNACVRSDLHRAWMSHPERKIVRVAEVGFDPTGKDKNILCNLWGGWPTKPSRNGYCELLLQTLRHMCDREDNSELLYQWLLKWLAYPIQNPGAKMRTAVVVHGPQGTGKNMFFEAVLSIYGKYGRLLDQDALEDKFNDWASHKLLVIADEVLSRSEAYRVKNKLKCFITGDRIRINPKNTKAYEEKNHVNVVFLSNESMPVVLEEDDRRHAVVWTPKGLPHTFYENVKKEIENGGVAALHDYLLNIDLTGFNEATRPPSTEAKRKLINNSLNNPRLFFDDFMNGDIKGFPAAASSLGLLLPTLTQDFYDLYGTWCQKTGERKLKLKSFIDDLVKNRDLIAGEKMRKRYTENFRVFGPSATVSHPKACEYTGEGPEQEWLGNRVVAFRQSLNEYRGAL